MTMAEFEQTEGFADLTYEQQQRARRGYIQRILSNKPEFAQASVQVKTEVTDTLLNRAPVLRTGESSAQEAINIAERVRRGDEKALEQAKGEYAKQTIVENAGLIGWVVEKTLSLTGNLPHPYTEEEGQDRRKAFDYLQRTVEEKAPGYSGAISVGVPIGMTIADIATGRIAAGSVVRGLKTAGGVVGKSARWFDDLMRTYGTVTGKAAAGTKNFLPPNAGQFTKWAVTSVLPQVAESGFDASIMTMRVLAQDAINERAFGEQTERTFGELAKTFGQEFAMDWMAMAAMRTLFNVGHGVKKATSGFFNAEKVITGETTEETLDGVVSGSLLSEGNWDALPTDLKQKMFREKGNILNREYNLHDYDDMGDIILTHNGFHVDRTGSRIVITRMKDGVKSSYGDMREALEQTFRSSLQDVETIGPVSSATIRRREFFDVGMSRGADKDYYNQVVSRLMGATDEAELFQRMQGRSIRGILDQSDWEKSVFGERLNLNYRTVPESEYIQSLSRKTGIDGGEILIPDTVSSKQTMDLFSEEFFTSIAKKDLTPVQRSRYDEYVKGFRSAQNEAFQRGSISLFENQVKTLDPNATLKMTSEGKVRLTIFGESAEFVDTRAALVSTFTSNFDLIQKNTEFTDLTDYLKQAFKAQGQKMEVRGEDGILRFNIENQKGEHIFETTSLETMFKERPDLIPQLPEQMMPGVYYNPVQEGTSQLVAEGKAFKGSINQIGKMQEDYFQKSVDDAISKVLVEESGEGTMRNALSFDRLSHEYEVEIPEMGVKKFFEDLGQAKKFLSEQRETWEDFRTIGRLKGIETHSIGGRLFAQRFGSKELIEFDSVQALKNFIKNEPAYKEVGKDFLGAFGRGFNEFLPEDLQKMANTHGLGGNMAAHSDTQFMREFEEWAETNFKGVKDEKRSTWGAFGYMFRHSEGNFNRMARELGDPELYRIGYTEIGERYHKMIGQTKMHDVVINKIFDAVPKKRRKELHPLFTVNINDEQLISKVIQKHGLGEVSEAELRMVREYRDYMNRMGQIFNVDYDRLISDYIPRVQTIMRRFNYTADETVEQFVRRTGQNVPGMQSPSFAKMRMKDLNEMASFTDPKEVTRLYIHKGYKDLLLKPAHDNALKYINDLAAQGKLESGDMAFAAKYLEGILGYERDGLQEMMRQASQHMVRQVNEKMGKYLSADGVDFRHVNDMTDILTDLTIFTTMSARPWLPIRNLQQVWTILGSLLDPSDVWRALKELGQGGAGKAFKDILTSGRLKTAITPLGERTSKYGPGIVGGNAMDALRSWNEVLMRGYQNSDSWTRMVATTAGGNVWDEAYELLQKGQIDFKKFMSKSKLNNLPEGDVYSIVKKMEQQGAEAARELYIDRITDMTLFSYRNADNPTIFKGMIGKLFGRFGHYPTSAANTYMNLLNPRKGSGAILNGIKLATTTAMVAGGARSIGLRAGQFTPWGQAIFTGGPWFEVLNGMRESLDFNTFEGSEARTRLVQDVGRLLTPVQLKAMKESIDYINDGDYLGGMAKLLSAPYQGFDGIHEW